MRSTFQVEQEEFEGPLDLLLQLIEERKLMVNDISLAEITESYIEHVKAIEETIDNISEFVAIASTLILIKSRSLLPELNVTLEEESAMNELFERLERYSFFKDLTEGITDLMHGPSLYPTRQKKVKAVQFRPPESLSLAELPHIAQALLEAVPKPIKRPQAVVRKVVSLDEVINRVRTRIRERLSLQFSELAKGGSPAEVVVHFLAILELVKQEVLDITQEEQWGDISIRQRSVTIPAYGRQ